MIYWGRPQSYPDGYSMVEKALLLFEVEGPLPNKKVGNNISIAFPEWLILFNIYVELIARQNLTIDTTVKNESDQLDLFSFGEEGKGNYHYRGKSAVLVFASGNDTSLKLEQLKQICNLCSSMKKPSIEYRVLLESFRAFESTDFRKSILEAATAVELSLTSRILEEFIAIGINFGDKLLKKFRMLGGRFELARLLDINLPVHDYRNLLIEPRNEVVHKATFPDRRIASEAIRVAEDLLKTCSSEISES